MSPSHDVANCQAAPSGEILAAPAVRLADYKIATMVLDGMASWACLTVPRPYGCDVVLFAARPGASFAWADASLECNEFVEPLLFSHTTRSCGK